MFAMHFVISTFIISYEIIESFLFIMYLLFIYHARVI